MKSSRARHESPLVFEDTTGHDSKALSHVLVHDTGVEVIGSSDGHAEVTNIAVVDYFVNQFYTQHKARSPRMKR